MALWQERERREKKTGIGTGLYRYIRKAFHNMHRATKMESMGRDEVMVRRGWTW
jgi:hypothetical protein